LIACFCIFPAYLFSDYIFVFRYVDRFELRKVLSAGMCLSALMVTTTISLPIFCGSGTNSISQDNVPLQFCC